MLLITKRRKIGTICGHTVYAITKSEMIPIPHASVRSKMAYSKDENRSLVNFTCTCNVSMVHFRSHMRVALRTIPYPLYLDEDYVMNRVLFIYFGVHSLYCVVKTFLLDHRIILVLIFYILVFFLCTTIYFVDRLSSVHMHNVGFLRSTLSSFCGTL